MQCMVPSMDTLFITIAEATEKTGRSASTIRRLIRTITETADHPDRDSIEPTAKQAATFKKKGENFTWKIREDIVMKNFGSAQHHDKKSITEPKTDILSILQNELSLKNQQIEKQWEVIHALNDRLREGNILMGSLQKRLGPPASESPTETTVEASVEPSKEAVTASTKEKRKFLGWLRK
jgi:hypothetical protein